MGSVDAQANKLALLGGRREGYRLGERDAHDEGARLLERRVGDHGAEALAQAFEADHDDYSAILVKALADRLAEAFTEHLHALTRKGWWGYAPDEELSNDDLIRERYRGIRPAPGYPAQPDHTEKRTLFALLATTEATGLALTEHFAMTPAEGGWRVEAVLPRTGTPR